jgi:hypothetical protein
MREPVSIWFFGGVLFLIYGLLITATGLWELGHPPAHLPELYHLHASVWWGGTMGIAGLVYTLKFRPRRR